MGMFSVTQRVFNFVLTLWVSSSSPLGSQCSRRALRPTRLGSHVSQPPLENPKSRPAVAPGPVTLEVKLKGNNATHHHFLHRKISISGLGAAVKCTSNLGGMVGK